MCHGHIIIKNAYKSAVFLSLNLSTSTYETIIPIIKNISSGNLYDTIFAPNSFINGIVEYAYKALCPPPKFIRYRGHLFKYLSTP